MDLIKKINQTTKYLEKNIDSKPIIGLILGSGLGDLADNIEDAIKIRYEDIPNFPVSTVEGHAGQLVFGILNGKRVVAMQGRFHFYEGYELEKATFPVRIMNALGVETLIVTNAAGGVNRDYNPADLMIIEDHINFTFRNPLIGLNYDELGDRFPDMSRAYDRDLISMAENIGEELDIGLKKGNYAWVTGPSYETPAEVNMMAKLGVDAVGMSTVPEVIIARHSGMRVLGISCITNMAAGILDQPLEHREVIETSEIAKDKFTKLMVNIIGRL